MGKKFCSCGNKWCKLLQRGVCKVSNTKPEDINKCPRIAAIETITLYQLIREIKFDDAFGRLCYYFPDQENSREEYESAFKELLKKKTNKTHNLNDLFICVEKEEYDGHEYLDTYGKMLRSNKRYGIEFCKWSDWVSMFIDRETLNSLSKEDIVAGCLFELTYDGFTESKVIEAKNNLSKTFEEMKNKAKEK